MATGFFFFTPKISILNDLGLNRVVLDIILTRKRILLVGLCQDSQWGPYKKIAENTLIIHSVATGYCTQ